MDSAIRTLLEKTETGQPLSQTEALSILHAQGANLSFILAGAHRLREQNFGDRIACCAIVNAKSGLCAEDCAFCAQSAHHHTEAPVHGLKSRAEIVAAARAAAAQGAECFGIVTSGSRIDDPAEFDQLLNALREIRKTTRLAPAASLGILDASRAAALAAAGCVTYHHNLETARSFFPQICTTHDYQQDIATIEVAKASGMRVCCGGLFGLGESPEQRVELAMTLRDLDVDSVPLNFLNPIPGTPLAGSSYLTPLDCVRIIALFRYLLPGKRITVCGGRQHNLRDLQSWIFMAGAGGVMIGNYLTTSGRNLEDDRQMFHDLEMKSDD